MREEEIKKKEKKKNMKKQQLTEDVTCSEDENEHYDSYENDETDTEPETNENIKNDDQFIFTRDDEEFLKYKAHCTDLPAVSNYGKYLYINNNITSIHYEINNCFN